MLAAQDCIAPRGRIASPSVALLVALGLSSGAAAWLPPTTSSAQDVAEGLPFSHSSHVNDRWWNDQQSKEYLQDCRGCHDYSSPPSAGSEGALSQSLCLSCHVAGSMVFSGASRVRPDAESSASFRHHEHNSMECRSCHGKQAWGEGAPEALPKTIPVPMVEGSRFCAGCHSDVEGPARERFYTGLNRRQGPVVARRFLHSTHIDVAVDLLATLTDADSCKNCHAGIYGADEKSLGSRQFDTQVCADCHEGVQFQTKVVERPSATAATFLHREHLGSGVYEDDHGLSERECLTCHRFDGAGSGSFILHERFSGDAHEGCVECHQDRKVDRHGENQACKSCHAVAEEGLTRHTSMAENRPRVTVRRPVPSSFDFQSHAHRSVTVAEGQEIGEACSDCHRANLEELPSRLRGRRFDHATHVAPTQEMTPAEIEETCVRCHAQARLSNHPVPGQEGTGYDSNSCSSCHEGGLAELAFAVMDRSILDFAHYTHLSARVPRTDGSGDRAIHCLDCHEPDQAQDASVLYVLKNDVADCTRCHGHREQVIAAIPKDLELEEVRACAVCHRPGIPFLGETIAVERLELVNGAGTHLHQGSRACTECHYRFGDAESGEAASVPAVRTADSDLTAERETAFKIHGPNRSRVEFRTSHFTDLYDYDPRSGERGIHCLHCHWPDLSKQAYKQSLFQLGMEAQVRREYGLPLDPPRNEDGSPVWHVGLPPSKR